jgi:hypothetical protein
MNVFAIVENTREGGVLKKIFYTIKRATEYLEKEIDDDCFYFSITEMEITE